MKSQQQSRPYVVIYGKKGCGLCKAAEEKLVLLNLPYRKVDMESPPEDWRETKLTDAMALYQLTNTLPFIQVGEQVVGYAAAMRLLKGGDHAQDTR